jgi:hypothetical protein
MRRPGLGRRMMRWALAAAMLALVAAVVVLPRVITEPGRRPTPVTEHRSVDGRRELDIRYTNEYLRDSAYETCDALSLETLAARLRVPATGPSAVARAFARQNFAKALRSGPYEGCVDALEDHDEDPGRWRGEGPLGPRGSGR